MLKKSIACLLIALLVVAPSVGAKSKVEKDAEKIKTAILKLGTGPDARVSLKLRDKTKVAGYIQEASAESFVVADANTGATTTVPYPNVTQVKGNNLSTGAKVAIVLGIAAAVLAIPAAPAAAGLSCFRASAASSRANFFAEGVARKRESTTPTNTAPPANTRGFRASA